MNTNYVDLVWFLNAVLVALVLLLGGWGLLHSAWLTAVERRRQPADRILVELFRSLAGKPVPEVAHELAAHGSAVTNDRWIRLINRHESFVPESVWPQLEAYLFTLPFIADLEELAAPGRCHKWRRIEAMKCLGHLHTPAALALLGQALEEEDEDIRYFALLSLAHMRTPQAARVLLTQLRRNGANGHKLVALLEVFPPEVVPDVYAALKSSDAQARFWLLKLLARFKVAVGAEMPMMIGFTRDLSPDVRAVACECLGHSNRGEAIAPLSQCLRDPLWYVRLQAVRALARIEGAASLPLLAELMAREPSVLVQESIKNVLMRDPAGALHTTDRFLSRDDRVVQTWCASALVDSNNVIKLLTQCLADEAPVRDHARGILRKLIESHLHFGLKQALDQLQAGARHRIVEFVAGVDAVLARHLEPEMMKGV